MEESTLRLAIQGIFRFLAAAEIVIVYGSASNNSRVHEIASSGMAWLPQLLNTASNPILSLHIPA